MKSLNESSAQVAWFFSDFSEFAGKTESKQISSVCRNRFISFSVPISRWSTNQSDFILAWNPNLWSWNESFDESKVTSKSVSSPWEFPAFSKTRFAILVVSPVGFIRHESMPRARSFTCSTPQNQTIVSTLIPTSCSFPNSSS